MDPRSWFLTSHKFFYEIVDFFVADMSPKPIICSKVAQKGKTCSTLLVPPKVARKLPSTIPLNYLEDWTFFNPIWGNNSIVP